MKCPKCKKKMRLQLHIETGDEWNGPDLWAEWVCLTIGPRGGECYDYGRHYPAPALDDYEKIQAWLQENYNG